MSSRADDLTADLLHDLAADHQPATVAPRRADTPSVVLEASLFLRPRSWLRPGLARDLRAVVLSAGPVRVRLGRRP